MTIMPKMMATDLDGTLLPSSKIITDHTIAILHKLHERGLKLVIATGRPIRDTEPYFDVIPWDAIICHNGAIILKDGQSIASFPIPYQSFFPFISQIFEEHPQTAVFLEKDETCYAINETERFWGDYPTLPCSFPGELPAHADKLLIPITNNIAIAKLQELLPPDIYMELSSDGSCAFLMHEEARKNKALARVAVLFDLSMSELVSFGDDINDLLMLQETGIGVATANAIPIVLENADYITASCEEEGVANWLKEYFHLHNNE